MKNKIKKLIIIGMIMLIISTFAITVNAETEGATGTFKVTVTADKTELKPGEEITITVGISDINMGENGINTVEGKIEYNKNLFEEIKSSSIQSLNNWTTTYNDEESTLNGKFLSINLSSGVKEDTQIFKVTLKVKQEIENTTDAQIDFKDVTSNDGTNLINAGAKSVKLKINVESNSEPIPEDPKPEDPKPEEPNKDETKEETESTINKIADKTQSNKDIPKAGKSIIMFFAVLLVVIVIVALGIKNRSMRDIK